MKTEQEKAWECFAKHQRYPVSYDDIAVNVFNLISCEYERVSLPVARDFFYCGFNYNKARDAELKEREKARRYNVRKLLSKIWGKWINREAARKDFEELNVLLEARGK